MYLLQIHPEPSKLYNGWWLGKPYDLNTRYSLKFKRSEHGVSSLRGLSARGLHFGIFSYGTS